MWPFTRTRRRDDDFREEVEAHIALETDRLVAQGLGPDEARHAALRAFGNVTVARERFYLSRTPWHGIAQDVRVTSRAWRRQPGFAIAAILVLALGLGASTALFGALDRVLFRPLPYTDPDRLVSVGLQMPGPGGSPIEAMFDRSYVRLWNTPPPPFVSVATTAGTGPCDIVDAQPERVSCAEVEHTFLRVLGVHVVAGRDFTHEDDLRGTPRVGLISHGLWVRRYGADPAAIGRTMVIDTETSERVPIAGVLPPDFEMPLGTADILLPAQIRPLDPQQQFDRFLAAFARLKPGLTPPQAESRLAPQLPAMLADWPSDLRGRASWRVRPLRDRQVGDASRVAWLLLGAVAVFLLIACANVANLMLARVAARRREFAVRAAIGGGRLRLARLALCESLMLSLTAGALGLLVAFALLKTFVALAPAGIPKMAGASLDARVFAVAILLAAITSVAVGLWPAFSVFRIGGLQALRSTGVSQAGTRPRARFGLVTAQIALTVALLGGSALLLRSLWNLVALPLGFEAGQVVTLTAHLGPTRYPTPERRAALFDELLARARVTPGAISAALSDAPAPLGLTLVSTTITVEGQRRDPGARHAAIRIREVTPQYFEVFRIPVTRGRDLVETDWQGEAQAAILSESAERILLGPQEGVGRRVQLPGGPDAPWHLVVGVVGDVRNGADVTDDPQPELYLARPRGEARREVAYLALRTTAPPADAAAYLRQIAADLDPTLPVTIESGSEQVARLTERSRFVAWLLSAFAALALALAAAGLYSVASYLVAQRTTEIGVRIALGATPRDVARQVVREAGRWISAGALLGFGLGWAVGRALQAQLYEVEALDPWSWAAALLALALVLVTAVFRPAYRAAHIDPIPALRAE